MGRHKKANHLTTAKQMKGRTTIKETSYDGMDLVILFVLSISAAIVPLILRIQRVELDVQTSREYKGELSYLDVFSHWKAQVLIFAFALMCLFLVVRTFQRRITSIPRIFIPLAVYTILVILSSVFSPYKWVAKHGFPDRLEGVYVLLAYVLLTVTGALTAKTDKARIVVIGLAMLSSVLLAILGASQYLGKDFLQTVIGRSLFIPDEYASLFDKLQFNFGKHYMYVTVYNPNYLGSYSALLLPIAVMLSFYWLEKKSYLSIFGFLFISTNFILWLGGMSRAGLLGGVVALLFLIVFGFRAILRHWKATVLIVLMCSLLFSNMDRLSDGAVSREFRNTLPSGIEAKLPRLEKTTGFNPFVVQSFAETVPASGKMTESDVALASVATLESATVISPENNPTPTPSPAFSPSGLPYVLTTTIDNNRFLFETTTETLIVKYEDGELLLFDEANHEIEYTINRSQDEVGADISTIAFSDPKYANYSLRLVSGGALLKWYWYTIPLIVVEDKLTVNTKQGVYESHIEKAEFFGFEGRESFASNRGYIWSRSIPLLRQTVFLGVGPDAYAIVFPQTDIAGKINWLSDNNMLVDKPHNWYLQMGINTGVISLLAMLVFLAWYLLQGIRLRNEPSLGEGRLIHVGIMSGVVGYLVAAMFNDSNVSVAPVFWVMLGLGLSYVLAAQQARSIRIKDSGRQGEQKPQVKT